MGNTDLPQPTRPLGRGLVAILLAWIFLVVAGMWLLIAYSFVGAKPARAAQTTTLWPKDATIARAPGLPTLVVALHPQCPCSRATIAELGRLLTHAPRKVDTHILMVRPTGTPEGWEQTDLWRAAAAIPGAAVHVDPGGENAARFGARDSGHVLLFDENGALLFEGGITAARGHQGESDGQDAILAALAHEPPGRTETPVFGCHLTTLANESP